MSDNEQVDPRRWWLPAGLFSGAMVSAFAVGAQYWASREAIKKLETVPTQASMKLAIGEAMNPMRVEVIEMRAEVRAENKSTNEKLEALSERVRALESGGNK